jgi:hypothetical protein
MCRKIKGLSVESPGHTNTYLIEIKRVAMCLGSLGAAKRGPKIREQSLNNIENK